MMEDNNENSVSQDADRLITELESHGATRQNIPLINGMGDLIHTALNTLGITEERYKAILGLSECNCKARRKYLNKLIPFNIKGS